MSRDAPAPAVIRWIGGASGAGKTVVARRLAHEHGLRPYATDEVMADHADRSTSEDAPLLARFAAMSMDERWVDRSPSEMLATFHWYAGEGFASIIDDLRRLAVAGPVLAEGFRLLPRLVAPLLRDRTHAVWLLPTPAFRRAALARRGDTWAIAGRTRDPDRALANLLERDRLFTEHLRDETARLGLQSITVDGRATEEALTTAVAAALGLDPAP